MPIPVCPYHGDRLLLEQKNNAEGDPVYRYKCDNGDWATSWMDTDNQAMAVRTMANVSNLPMDNVLGALKITSVNTSTGSDIVAIKDGTNALQKLAVDSNGRIGVNNLPAPGLTNTELRASPLTVIGVGIQPADKAVTAVGAAAAAVTLTLPLVAGQFHYINSLDITMYNTAARTGTATPVTVTSTNLPGSLAWTFPSAGAIGTITQIFPPLSEPLRSSAAGVATTIVCPATASVIWRVNATYFTAA